MAVVQFLLGQPLQSMGNTANWPRDYICDTWAERPTSGLVIGSRCFAKDSSNWYIATGAATWTQVNGGGAGGASAWGDITGTLSNQTDLQTALNAKGTSNFSGAYADLSGKPALFDGAYSSLSGIPSTFTPAAHSQAASTISDSTVTGRAVLTAADAAAARTAIGAGTSSFSGAYANLSGIPATFAPIIGASGTQACAGNDSRLSDARTPTAHTQDASTITSGTMAPVRLGSGTADSTTYLRGDGTWATPAGGGGSDPWTYIRLVGDFTTSSSSAVDITGLAFTPAANQRYEFVGRLFVRTATATVGPRPGVAWATGLTDGVVFIQQTSSATANVFANGNIAAAVLAPVGGLPNTTQSWPALIEGTVTAGATPSGTIKLQLASETAGTVVTAKAGSFIKYRTIP